MVGRPGHELFGKFNLVPFRERPAQNLRIAQRGFTGSISETEPNKEREGEKKINERGEKDQVVGMGAGTKT